MYFLKREKIQFVMRKFCFHAMKIAISWLFLGKGKTQEGAGLCNREQLRVEQDRSLAHKIVLGEPVLVPNLKEHLVSHRVQRKKKSAGELLKDRVPVTLGDLRLLLVLVQDHFDIRVALVSWTIHVRQIRASDNSDADSFSALKLDREDDEGGLDWCHTTDR